MAVMEILKSTMRTRDYVLKGETEGRSLDRRDARRQQSTGCRRSTTRSRSSGTRAIDLARTTRWLYVDEPDESRSPADGRTGGGGNRRPEGSTSESGSMLSMLE